MLEPPPENDRPLLMLGPRENDEPPPLRMLGPPPENDRPLLMLGPREKEPPPP
jgi:hypothetical protein